MQKLAFGLLLTTLSSVAAAQNSAHLDWLNANYEQTAQTARSLWEFAEVGYQETRSSQLTDWERQRS